MSLTVATRRARAVTPSPATRARETRGIFVPVRITARRPRADADANEATNGADSRRFDASIDYDRSERPVERDRARVRWTETRAVVEIARARVCASMRGDGERGPGRDEG